MYLTFDDVLIKPGFSNITSRKEVRLHSNLGHIQFTLPIISANMDTVTGPKMADAMRKFGAIGCLHRFSEPDQTLDMVNQLNENSVLVSFGLGDKEKNRVEKLKNKTKVMGFVLDVAHGAQQQVVDQTRWFKENYPDKVLVVGNFADYSSLGRFLILLGDEQFYPDAVKIGIGPGSACTTRVKTGCGVPQITAIQQCKALLKNQSNLVGMPAIGKDIKLIADGGMRTSGDIAKALAAGADLVMLGGMLAGTDECPGYIEPTVDDLKNPAHLRQDKLMYRGSASRESYADQNKDWDTAEGESFWVDLKGPVSNILNEIKGGLQSAFTYVGVKDLDSFHKKATLIQVSPSARYMNEAHGKK